MSEDPVCQADVISFWSDTVTISQKKGKDFYNVGLKWFSCEGVFIF